jgi:hypothetical protein
VRVRYYDPVERQREKQHAREQDDRDLREGYVSREELSERNSLFAGLNLSGSFVRRRNSIA